MKNRRWKKIFRCIIVCCLALNISVFTVYADGIDELGKIVDGSVLTNQSSSEKMEPSILRGNYLNQGIAKITDSGNGNVNVYGSTTCHVTCDRVTLDLTLQRYSGGYWYNVKTYESSANNVHSLTKSYNTSVTKGYYYRIKALCTAKKGSTVESQTPTTDGIWIN